MQNFTGQGWALFMAIDRRQTMLVSRPRTLTERALALAPAASRLCAENAGTTATGGLASPFDDIGTANGNGQHLGLLRSAANAIAAFAERTFRRSLERNTIPVAVVERSKPRGVRTMIDLKQSFQ